MADRPVVHRPEPPSDEPAPKLTRDEVRALLAVTATTNPPSRWGRAAKRGGLALLPTAILSTVLDAIVGWWSIPIVVALAIAWSALPLLRQSRDGWT